MRVKYFAVAILTSLLVCIFNSGCGNLNMGGKFANVSLTSISSADLERIETAIPTKATAKPQKPRKLLVFNLCKGFAHSSIPYAAIALELMGDKTGAYEVVQSSDMSMFRPENLQEFDAVCFNNTTQLDFSDAGLRKSLMDFVRSGKGVVGIHAATDNFYDWEEGAEMMGGLFDGHPWTEKVGIKLDEPGHKLARVFEGRGFEVFDEIYAFRSPYSREKLRVLLSIDPEKTNMNKLGINRKDGDFAVSWVRDWGKGRVFYCSLGHDHAIFWNPVVLRYYLDGIQFALGDLDVETAPSAEIDK